MSNLAVCNSTDLKGSLLKVVILPWIGLSERHSEPNSTKFHYTGLFMDILSLLAESMNFTYTLVEPNDMQWGVIDNGTWTGAVKMLYSGEADLAVGHFALNAARFSVVHYLPVIWGNYDVIISRIKEGQLSLFLDTFSANTWWALLLCTLLILVSIWLVIKGYTMLYGKRAETFMECAYIVLVPTGSHWQPIHWGTRFIMFSWYIFIVTICAIYTARLVSMFAVSVPLPAIGNAEELMENSDYKAIVVKGTHMYQAMQDATDGMHKVLWERMNHQTIVLDPGEVGNLLTSNEKYVYIEDVQTVATMLQTYSGLGSSFTHVNSRYETFLTQKDSPHICSFEETIYRLLEAGVFDHMRNNLVRKSMTMVTGSSTNALDLDKLRDVFWILLFGAIGVAIIITCEYVTEFWVCV